jgi:uncharacterized protein YdgA (DUF945 family)
MADIFQLAVIIALVIVAVGLAWYAIRRERAE